MRVLALGGLLIVAVLTGCSDGEPSASADRFEVADRLVCRRVLAAATGGGRLTAEDLEEWDRISREARRSSPGVRRLVARARLELREGRPSAEPAEPGGPYASLVTGCNVKGYDFEGD